MAGSVLKGALLQTELAHIEGVTHEENGVLKRATLWPIFDFLVLPLTQEKLSAIEKAVIYKIAFGNRGIIHVQIERNVKMAFSAYDGFQHAVPYSAVPGALLEELTEKRVPRNYQRLLQSAG
jgi:hypothetical protein